jgi:cytohesin
MVMNRGHSGFAGMTPVKSRTQDQVPSLQEVLKRINDAVDDFASRPATRASDLGAFGDYPLHKVAIWGDIQAAKALLDHGADINARGEDDDTALHRAIAGDHPEMVRFLLSRGADPDLKNRYRHSPRDDATSSKNREIADLIP